MAISQDSKQAFSNPWVLGWLGMLVGVVLVNVIFIVTAFKTSPGLVDEEYYEKGRAVEENFQERLKARNRLGWDIGLQVPEEVFVGRAGNYTVNIVDQVGMPIREAEVALQAYRPSDASADINAPMEPIAGGVYQTRLNLPLKGVWDMVVTVRQGDDELQIERRINAVLP
ncbi:MAG: FixH family protein [Pseudomonadota bacterium]